MFRSLRSRLLAVTVIPLLVGMVVLIGAGNVLLAHTIASDNSQRLSSRLNEQITALSVGPHGTITVRDTLNDAILDSYAWVYSGARLIEAPRGTSVAVDRLAGRLAHAQTRNPVLAPGDILLGRRRVDGATIVAGVSIAQLETLRRAVLVGSLAVGLLVLGAVAVSVRRALAAALAPVQQMTRDAGEWEAHDLDRRFNLGPARDEITGLAARLDHLLARIAASRRHEQRFAAEVGHELRTPLAAIRGVAELAADVEDVEEARLALSDIQSHSSRIGATLDTLIAFARGEVAPKQSGVDLESVVREFDGVKVERVGSIPRVEGDPALIRQVLAPLIENARRYASAAVWVELRTRERFALAVVRDDGPGIDDDLGVTIFLPGVRGAAAHGDGAGLGLPLAQRLARSCGGEIQLGQGPGGCFLVLLPAIGDPPGEESRPAAESSDPAPAA
ncbi:MAG: HAMP domain-containing histidine kinase [Solirubrobacterales bacterium]|nr:HAMP domain-containing histidine kinase [Solirubrobacterales bacterium]